MELPLENSSAVRWATTYAANYDEQSLECRASWCTKEIARIAPWCLAYVGPQLEGADCFGEVGSREPLWGRAYSSPANRNGDVVFVRADMREDDVRGTLWHELWHIVEKYINADALALVDQAHTRAGGAWGGASKLCSDPRKTLSTAGDFDSSYMRSPVERRARLFALWCLLIEEGGDAVLPPPPETAKLRDWRDVFECVRCGEFARVLVKGGRFPQE